MAIAHGVSDECEAVPACAICLNTKKDLQPWPAKCGHAFCLDCSLELVQSKVDMPGCPLCRRKLPMCHSRAVALLLSHAPHAEEPDFELMLLGNCPIRFERGMCITLHLRDDCCYNSIIAHCWGSEHRFGIVSEPATVGSVGRIAEVRHGKKMNDGSHEVQIVGRQRFEVLKHQHVADCGSSAPCLSSACVRAIDEPLELCEGLELPLCFMSSTNNRFHTPLRQGMVVGLRLMEADCQHMVECALGFDNCFGLVLRRPISVGGIGRLVSIVDYNQGCDRIVVRIQKPFKIRRFDVMSGPDNPIEYFVRGTVDLLADDAQRCCTCNPVHAFKQIIYNCGI